MTPRDLLDLADELTGDDRESAWRAATHCAYYAAFHTASQLLTQAGFAVPQADRAHAYLWYRLENSGHPEVTQSGVDLNESRKVRNHADYDINRSFHYKLATAQVARAIRVIELLGQVAQSRETLARITDAMRTYERDVLRDVTWHDPASP